MIITPSKDILDRFEATYFRKEDAWLFPCYRLGFVSAIDSDTFFKCGQLKCQESLIAFNNGYRDGQALTQGREKAEKSMQVTAAKTAIYKDSTLNSQSTKEYTPPF